MDGANRTGSVQTENARKIGEVGMKSIAEIMIELSDQELIDMLPTIRDEDGERLVSLVQLKHILREEVQRIRKGRSDGHGL